MYRRKGRTTVVQDVIRSRLEHILYFQLENSHRTNILINAFHLKAYIIYKIVNP